MEIHSLETFYIQGQWARKYFAEENSVLVTGHEGTGDWPRTSCGPGQVVKGGWQLRA
jgi:hypothetical protein